MEPLAHVLTRRRLIILSAGTVVTVAATGRFFGSRRPGSTISPVDPGEVYDPFQAGARVPDGYLQIVGRDLIRPVYEPRFVPADDIGWPDDADVIGVEIDGDARAYPVGFLSGREMVNDEVAGDPVLVTW